MARFRLSRPAQMDVARIFSTSAERWGAEAWRRYAATLATAMRQVAADPQGRVTHSRGDLLPGVRSFHLRHARVDDPGSRVRQPVHVLYFRAVAPELIEIIRVLHERMEPARQIGEVAADGLDEAPMDPEPPPISPPLTAGLRRHAVLHKSRRMHARRRGRAPD